MASRKVGNEPFTIQRIVGEIRDSTTFGDFRRSWTGLTSNLGVRQPEALNHELGLRVTLEQSTFDELIVRLLQKWVAEKANRATIDALCLALERSGHSDISARLQEAFGISLVRPPGVREGEEGQKMPRPSASVAPQVRQRPQEPTQSVESPNQEEDEDANTRRVERPSSFSYIS